MAEHREFSREYGFYYKLPSHASTLLEGGLRLQKTHKEFRAFLNRDPGKPIVSVITVCYNSRKTLSDTIHSIACQSYKNIDYILIDGGSTDGTTDVANENDSIISYYVSEPDGGIYNAINKGLSLAQGEYCLILNSDDWYEPFAIEELAEGATILKQQLVGALARYIGSTASVFRSIPYDMSTLLRMPIRHPTLLVHRDLYKTYGLYSEDFKIISDFHFVSKLFKNGVKYFEIPKPLVNFRLGGISNTGYEDLCKETKKLLQENFPFLSDHDAIQLADTKNSDPSLYRQLISSYPGEKTFFRSIAALLHDRKYSQGGKIWTAYDEKRDLPREKHGIPEVSIIVPVYNKVDSIARCFNSLVGQTGVNMEIIFIDDKSTDGSSLVLNEIENNSDNAIVVRNKINMGPAYSRNRGIALAKGDHLMFIDADDEIAANTLSNMLQIAKKHSLDILRAGQMHYQRSHGRDNNGSIKVPGGFTCFTVVNRRAELVKLLSSTEGHCAAIYRTDFISRIHYPEDILMGEDSLFFIYSQILAKKVAVTPECLYIYHSSSGSLMSTVSLRKALDGLEWRKRASYILSVHGFPERSQYFYGKYWSLDYFRNICRSLNSIDLQLYYNSLKNHFRVWEGSSRGGKIKSEEYLECIESFCNSSQDSIGNYSHLKIATLCTFATGGAGIGSQRRVANQVRHGISNKLMSIFTSNQSEVVPIMPITGSNVDDAFKLWSRTTIVTKEIDSNLTAREAFSNARSIVDGYSLKAQLKGFTLIHFHWVVGLIDFSMLNSIIGERPLVWTLADMNAFTGGCHYSEGCTEFVNGCKSCHLLSHGSDLPNRVWKEKYDAIRSVKNLTVICPSIWLKDHAQKSPILGNAKVIHIPNGISRESFRPMNKKVAKLRLGLDPQKEYIIFGAQSLKNARKGGIVLQQMVAMISEYLRERKIEIILFGRNSLDLQIRSHSFGSVEDASILATIYSSASLLAFSSLEDNSPFTIAESMLCGTAAVSFPVGNIPEYIEHKRNGYIAEYANVHDFAEGVKWFFGLSKQDQFSQGLRASIKARRYFCPDNSFRKHLELYSSLAPCSKE